ncbi:c-type cytochrome [Rhodobacter calidifons]|uniref:C-type cytochrome n=1 Tax=Rhodobacter calidifons TaxID=2715277 RepID=A0ABX0G755_9RHOB|nr:c-type cytochrome [Rhodobacter calidifons]NHB76954.1 c-type cytochrome [Rhodobacter calidifons]
MKYHLAAALALVAAPALAQDAPTGDAAAGEKVFNKCQTCHVIANEAGEVLAGKGSKTGPNLYGLPGRIAGTYPDFKYGESIVAVGAAGFAWNEEDFVVYLADPVKFLKDKTGDSKAKSKMSYKLPKEDEARDVWAFIASLSPAPEAAEGEAEAAPASN